MISANRYCSSCGAVNTPEVQVCFACGLSLKTTAPLSLETPSNHRPFLQGRYRILEQVGKGGFSAVYKAEDTLFDYGDDAHNAHNGHDESQRVAIKAVTLNGLKPQAVIEATDAFNREMQMLSELKHPDMPRVYGHFSEAECWYLVMDFIEGVTLEKHLETLADRRLPVDEVLELGLMLCTALEYLHTRQPPVIFRDLKPTNIMLKPDGRICLIDFGIARRFRVGQVKDTIPFGSPGYAAPEQYGKAQTTPRADIYSLGVMLHQLLTGDDPAQTPFHFAPLPINDQPTLSSLEPLLMRMVEVDTEKRPASISVIKKELQNIARDWATRRSYGYSPQTWGTQKSTRQPVMMSWQTSQPAPTPSPGNKAIYVISGNSSASGNATQMSQQIMPQKKARRGNPFRASTVYWSIPPMKQTWNRMATASLTCGLLNLILPLVLCGVGSYGSDFYFYSSFVPLVLFLPIVTMAILSLLAIIFGHIGRYRARIVPGWFASKDAATAGLTLGYVFGLLSFGIILCSFYNVWVGR